jgi:putative addiction module killer protein
MNDPKPIGYLIMAVGNPFGLTSGNRSDTFMTYTVKRLPEFDNWILGIKDITTRLRLLRRLKRVLQGLLGDHGGVGEDVFEFREHFGPGWRMYFIKQDGIIVVMLGGGNKSSQAADIEAAKRLARKLKGFES